MEGLTLRTVEEYTVLDKQEVIQDYMDDCGYTLEQANAALTNLIETTWECQS